MKYIATGERRQAADEYDELMDEINYHKADAKKWNDEVNALLTLAEDAHAAWDRDDNARVGKLLLAMMDEVFRKQYRPDLVKVGADKTATPNAELRPTGAGLSRQVEP